MCLEMPRCVVEIFQGLELFSGSSLTICIMCSYHVKNVKFEMEQRSLLRALSPRVRRQSASLFVATAFCISLVASVEPRLWGV